MAGWRERWHAMVASEGSAQDGPSWEFTRRGSGTRAWAVFRADGGPFPVFSSARGDGDLPPQQDLRAMTEEAVADLLASAGHPDPVGWMTRNIAAALMMASLEIASWEGEEWAVESDERGMAPAWATPDDARTPYAWLRARADRWDALVDIYQDDAVFGLNFVQTQFHRRLTDDDSGSLRSRRDLPLVTGRIAHVEVVYDTRVEGGVCPGVVTEVLLHGDSTSTLLVAAEAYSRTEWHLYDESVIALPDPAAADVLPWVPERRRWHPTYGRP